MGVDVKPDRAKRIENMIDAACPKGIFGATSDTMAARHRGAVAAVRRYLELVGAQVQPPLEELTELRAQLAQATERAEAAERIARGMEALADWQYKWIRDTVVKLDTKEPIVIEPKETP